MTRPLTGPNGHLSNLSLRSSVLHKLLTTYSLKMLVIIQQPHTNTTQIHIYLLFLVINSLRYTY